MKRNILLLLTVTTIGIICLEYFASFKINELIKRNGYTKELIEFYDHYYKELHHLGRLNEADSQNPSSLIFEQVGDGSSVVIVQGDSWAKQYRTDESKEYLKRFIQKKSHHKIILAGTGSYSPSIMTSQLFLLRNNFGYNPDILVAVIDQTDIGDELCRYKKLRNKENGRVIVRPEDENSVEYNSAYFIIDNFKMFMSDNFSILKVFHYFKNYLKQKNNLKKNKIRCGRDEILSPLKNGLIKNEERYFIDVLLDYFNEAFSSPYLKKLIILTHPHRKHLSGEYILDVEDLIYKARSRSKFSKNIKVVSFGKQFRGKSNNELDNIFVDNDAYSHLSEEYFQSSILPKVILEIK